MRLLFVVKTLAAQAGGAEKVLAQLSSELARRGHTVTVATFDSPQDFDFYDLDDRVRRARLSTCRRDKSIRLSEALRIVSKLRELIRATNPQVAIGFMHSAYVLLAAAVAGTGVRVVGSEHTSVKHFQSRSFEWLLVRVAGPLLNRMTVPAEAIRAQFPDSLSRRMVVIPNPVAGAGHRRLSSHRKRLLTVGRLSPEKGHCILLQAFAKVAERHRDWTLRIVGDGELRWELDQAMRNLGIESQTEFAGVLRDVIPELAAADLYVVPSAYESFGIATAEALASGVPAIGFADCPGTSELIRTGVNGVLVEPGQDRIQALTDALDELMSSSSRRLELGRAGPATVRDYTLGTTVAGWEALLLDVLAQPSQ